MSDANFVKVSCTCGKNFKAPATAVGKRARCPGCGATLTIAAAPAARSSRPAPAASAMQRASTAVAQSRPVTRPQLQPAMAAVSDDPFDALDELARQEETAAPLEDAARCDNCAAPMAQGAVLCTNCGFDTRTGKKLGVQKAAAPVSPATLAGRGEKIKGAVDQNAPTGSFAMGLVLSLVFAAVASIVWIALAYLTGFTIGYVAILIGAAAGIGMHLGHKGHSRLGGITAAALTLAVILAAKLIVLEMYLARMHPPRTIDTYDSVKLGYYFFSPIGLVIIAVGVAAAFRTANGSIRE